MKIVHFPNAGAPDGPEDFAAQLDAALFGDDGGSQADAWCELRDDVRTLATPMSPQFEAALRERIEQRSAAPRLARRRVSPRATLARVPAWLGSGLGPRLIALGGICAMAAIVVLAIAAPWRSEQLASSSFSDRVAIPSSGRIVQQTAPFSSSASGKASSSEPSAAGGSTPYIKRGASGAISQPLLPRHQVLLWPAADLRPAP